MREIHVIAHLQGPTGSWVRMEPSDNIPKLRPSTYKVRKPLSEDAILIVWWRQRISVDLMDSHSEQLALQTTSELD